MISTRSIGFVTRVALGSTLKPKPQILVRYLSNYTQNPLFQSSSSYVTPREESETQLLRPCNSTKLTLIQKRYKTKKRKVPKPIKDDADEESEEEDDGVEENPMLEDDLGSDANDGSKEFTCEVGSMRLDNVAKLALSASRVRIEEAIYKGELFVNGQRPNKKNQDVVQGDELDLFLRVNPEDHTLSDYKRAIILKTPDFANSAGRYKLTIRGYQSITIKPHGSE